MANPKEIFRTMFPLYFLTITLIALPYIFAKDSKGSDISQVTFRDTIQQNAKKNQISDKEINKSKTKGTIFEPLKLHFPDTASRKGEAATKYVNDLMSTFNSGASDQNLIMTGESCARGLGSLYVAKTDEGKTLYSVCFNDNTSSAIYSTHTIDLADRTLERSKHLSFKAKYTLWGSKINELYNAESQTKAFNEKFIPFTDPDTKKMKYMSRNHLTPHADFALSHHQTLTYYFQNCFPGMQSMNAQNWSKLEDFVRGLSHQMKKVLRIFTGVYGILKKKTKSGQMMDVYLDPIDERVEVPLIVWKLVIDQKTNDTVAFFTSNDTEMDEDEKMHFSTICNSVCDELAYKFNEDAKAGYTVCCRYEEFAKHIQFIPFKLAKTNLLKNTIRIERSNSLKSNSRSKSPPKIMRTNSLDRATSFKPKPTLRRSNSDSKLYTNLGSSQKMPSSPKNKNFDGSKSSPKIMKTNSLDRATPFKPTPILRRSKSDSKLYTNLGSSQKMPSSPKNKNFDGSKSSPKIMRTNSLDRATPFKPKPRLKRSKSDSKLYTNFGSSQKMPSSPKNKNFDGSAQESAPKLKRSSSTRSISSNRVSTLKHSKSDSNLFSKIAAKPPSSSKRSSSQKLTRSKSTSKWHR